MEVRDLQDHKVLQALVELKGFKALQEILEG
jgi:hypothetical protein